MRNMNLLILSWIYVGVREGTPVDVATKWDEISGSDVRCFLSPSLFFGVTASAICLQRVSLSHCLTTAPLLCAGLYLCFVFLLGQHDFDAQYNVLNPVWLFLSYSELRVVSCADSLKPIFPLLSLFVSSLRLKEQYECFISGVHGCDSKHRIMPKTKDVDKYPNVSCSKTWSRAIVCEFECVIVCCSFGLILGMYPVHYSVT